MASTTSPSLSPFFQSKKYRHAAARHVRLVVAESTGSETPVTGEKRKPRVDTRIHWSSPDEGWIGSKPKQEAKDDKKDHQRQHLGARFADLIHKSTDSHYQLLGISAEADVEEIKAAYRRLSKEYHPDTTSLPLKAASEKFIQLREAYNVLSDEESRRFYDWTLVQEAESRRAERMRMKLEDPYQLDVKNWETIPDTVNRLGGKNMDLSDQAMTALTIDVGIIIFSICCIIYYIYFKEPY